MLKPFKRFYLRACLPQPRPRKDTEGWLDYLRYRWRFWKKRKARVAKVEKEFYRMLRHHHRARIASWWIKYCEEEFGFELGILERSILLLRAMGKDKVRLERLSQRFDWAEEFKSQLQADGGYLPHKYALTPEAILKKLDRGRRQDPDEAELYTFLEQAVKNTLAEEELRYDA